MRLIASALAVVALGSAFAAATGAPMPPYVVHIKDFAYAPAPLHVRAGETVRFVNDDDEAHTVTATDASFASKGLDTHESWDHTFAKPGSYAYFCELHPYMKATVIVDGAAP